MANRNYRRIQKLTAKKLFNDGKTVIICGNKLNPREYSGVGVFELNRNSFFNGDFDSLVNTFKQYNCNYKLGYYPSFYIELE